MSWAGVSLWLGGPQHRSKTRCQAGSQLSTDIQGSVPPSSQQLSGGRSTWGGVPSDKAGGLSSFFVIPSERGWRKLEAFVWWVRTRYLRKLEKFRVQSSWQVCNKTSKTAGLESNIYKQKCEQFFFSPLLPPLIFFFNQKMLEVKFMYVKHDLIISISLARKVIDYIIFFFFFFGYACSM